MPKNSLHEAVIAVVGATGGLGQEFVNQLQAKGARPIGFARQNARLANLRVPSAAVDIADPGAGKIIIDLATEYYGRLDGVINASGTVGFGDALETTADEYQQLMLLNALGPIGLTQDVAEALAETRGFMLHISGVVSEQAYPGMSAYCASKSALAAFIASSRREFRRKKISLFDARPPHTETGLATRPLFGQAPKMPTGLAPCDVVARMITAIENGELDLPSTSFTEV